jgi:hypothetical protein
MGCTHGLQALKMKLGMACARMARTNMPLLSRPVSHIGFRWLARRPARRLGQPNRYLTSTAPQRVLRCSGVAR